jgi:hypothetical protein
MSEGRGQRTESRNQISDIERQNAAKQKPKLKLVKPRSLILVAILKSKIENPKSQLSGEDS